MAFIVIFYEQNNMDQETEFVERPPAYREALFKAKRKTKVLLCSHCKCELRDQWEMKPAEMMAMLGLTNIRPKFCESCRKTLSEWYRKWWDYRKKTFNVSDGII